MILRTAQNCSHGRAFAVDGGTTNCALTRWLIGSFAVPFDLGYVAAPGFCSSAAARTKADRWQLEEQRRGRGTTSCNNSSHHHHIKAANGTTHRYTHHRHFARLYVSQKLRQRYFTTTHLSSPAMQPSRTVMFFYGLAGDHHAKKKAVCDAKRRN